MQPRFRLPSPVNATLLVMAAVALLVSLARSEASPGIEVVRADPPAGVDAIRVHVRGAVASPGVVTAEPGDRVQDVVARAGGALPEADLGALNLALRVRDQDVVDVPLRGAPLAATALVDINTATAGELEALPGIGPARAADIIAARPYAGSDELLDRGVLTPAVYDQVRALVTVR